MALETAVQPGSIALLENSQLLAQVELAGDRRTTRSVLPAIHQNLSDLGWKPADLRVVAVSQGPGSFTGLRVGITVAKTLAYALGADVLGIDTLDVVAHQAKSPAPSLWAVMDAQRQQLFGARYTRDSAGNWRISDPPRVLAIEAWLAALSAGELVSGPPLEKLRGRLPAEVIVEDAAHFAPQAGTVGEIAAAAHHGGRRDDLWGLVPQYHRLSAAEEKRAARDASS